MHREDFKVFGGAHSSFLILLPGPFGNVASIASFNNKILQKRGFQGFSFAACVCMWCRPLKKIDMLPLCSNLYNYWLADGEFCC